VDKRPLPKFEKSVFEMKYQNEKGSSWTKEKEVPKKEEVVEEPVKPKH
jgi:hypothetical protein